MSKHRWAVNAFFFINGIILASWAARLPYFQEVLGIGHQEIGWILLAHALGAFIGMPITGWMIVKYGSRAITAVSGVLFPVFFLTLPFFDNFYLLLIPFFLMGAASGIMDVAMNAQAVLIEEGMGKPIMTMFHALFSIGMVLGGLLSSLFQGFTESIFVHFGVIGMLSLIGLVFSSFYLFPDNKPEESSDSMFAWPKGPIIGLGIIAFCCMMGEGAMADWSAIYMDDIMTVTEQFQAFGLIAFASMMTFGRLFGDQGRERFGDRAMLVYGAIISLVGMLFILTTVNMYFVIAGFALVGLGLSNIVPIVYSLAGSYPGLNPGVGIAMSTTIGYTGFMFGPPIIGFLADSFNLRIALLFLALLFCLMFILVMGYRSPNQV